MQNRSGLKRAVTFGLAGRIRNLAFLAVRLPKKRETD